MRVGVNSPVPLVLDECRNTAVLWWGVPRAHGSASVIGARDILCYFNAQSEQVSKVGKLLHPTKPQPEVMSARDFPSTLVAELRPYELKSMGLTANAYQKYLDDPILLYGTGE